jgi:hypothetical protein
MVIPMSKLTGAFAAAALALGVGVASASAQTVYSTDFTNPATLGAGVAEVTTTGGGLIENVGSGVVGFYTGDVFRNATGGAPTGAPGNLSTWSLTGLGAHDSLSVSFTAAFLDSWDSTDGAPAPDYLNIYLDGVQVLQLTSAAASGSVTVLGGGTEVAFGDLFDSAGGYYSHDRIVDMSTASSLTFAHTGSSFVLGISASGAGWQGGDDESWGIDNLSITANQGAGGGVPEPASWALMILGFGGAGAALRGRRRAATATA